MIELLAPALPVGIVCATALVGWRMWLRHRERAIADTFAQVRDELARLRSLAEQTAATVDAHSNSLETVGGKLRRLLNKDAMGAA